ncbi:flagellar assembly protein FliW [Alkalibaculum sp. M08DMB]|uniref:Flagellar assembly factor FliW n=1 Tax=Alkalibaculum sporogenes TaxID=2655001 RepID=A0A6A7K5L2_9FIRM|nr:flagellar assembly protein FliW [Alkalibaculum sporogenes]MPW24769.1 flagellar assembly protein FliW [Alkalibaculum sporogenes]
MIIKTKYLGEIEINQDQVHTFPYGLLGFEEHKEFVLIDVPENYNFKFLQDIKSSYVSFLLICPGVFYKNYDIEIPDNELKSIDIECYDDSINIYNVVTLGETLKDSTCNLLAPIIINNANKKGRQFILNNTQYTTKHKLIVEELGE